jgi:hypothetical protein
MNKSAGHEEERETGAGGSATETALKHKSLSPVRGRGLGEGAALAARNASPLS